MLFAGCSLLVGVCWLLLFCRFLDLGCSVFVVRWWLVVVGCSLFVVRLVGCSVFVVACWLVGVGCWLLVISC